MTEEKKDKVSMLALGTASVTSSTSITASLTIEPISYNYIRPADEHPIYALVGQVAAEWSHLEHELDRIIWALLKVLSSEAACVTSQLMGATPRYKTIIAQLTLRKASEPQFGKFIDTVNQLMQRSFDPQEKRNRIVHDAWYFETNRSQTAQFRAWPQKDLRFGINPVDLAEIENALAAIRKLNERINTFSTEIFAEIAASKQRRP
jgi:hypothetical protein